MTHKPKIEFHGPAATHDQCCAVMHGESAVLDTNSGAFQPSWKAESEGWRLVLAGNWMQRAAVRLLWGG